MTEPTLFDAVDGELERLELKPKPWQTSGLDAHPGRARNTDPATSKAGAADVAYRAGSQKAKLLEAYRAFPTYGLTDEEAAEFAGLRLKPSCCWWKRCNELRQDGWIVPTGEERIGSAGTPRMVCKVAR